LLSYVLIKNIFRQLKSGFRLTATYFSLLVQSKVDKRNTPQLNRWSLLCFNFLHGNLLNSLRSNRRKLP